MGTKRGFQLRLSGKFFLLLFFCLLLPVQAYAGAVIGEDTIFAIQPIVFLADGTPEAGVFNYFFTLGIFSGMIALFIRVCLKILKL